MIYNADYVFSLLKDPEGRARKAQVGVDLTLKGLKRISESLPEEDCPIILNDFDHNGDKKTTYGRYDIVSVDDAGYFRVEPGCYSIEFEQGINPLPANNTAFIYHRSTLGRNGALIRSAVYDPGFTTETMGAILEVHRTIYIEQFARVAQIVIYENVPVSQTYNGQYQGDKDRK